MPQYHHKAWHHLIGAAAAVLLLAVAAVPFGASARDTAVPSGKVGAGTIQDGGARKVETGKRAKPEGAGRKIKPPKDTPKSVRTNDPAKKGGKCTPKQCQALKNACDEKKEKSCGVVGGLIEGTRCTVDEVRRNWDSCQSISCEGAC